MTGRLIDAGSFSRFALVGAAGFVVDAGLLQILVALGWGPVIARCVALPAAVFATWLLNRSFTFPEAQQGPALASLARYFAVSAAGACVNFLVYTVLVVASPTMATWPMLAVAVGSVIAMIVNYLGSKHFAFKA